MLAKVYGATIDSLTKSRESRRLRYDTSRAQGEKPPELRYRKQLRANRAAQGSVVQVQSQCRLAPYRFERRGECRAYPRRDI